MTTRRPGVPTFVASAIVASFALSTGCSSTPTPNAGGPANQGAAADGTAVVNGLANSPITLPAGTPRRGGTLTYGLEGDTDGFDPAVARLSAPGLIMANAVYDPLAAFAADGTAKPYLAEKIESSADYKTWTVTMRSGIKFHNGEVLDADAVALHFKKMRDSPLTNAALDLIDATNPTTKVSDGVLQVNMVAPWALFPALLTGQLGMVPAPAFYKEPEASKRADNPIGTGPFKLANREKNRATEMVRNPDYWRRDAEGTQLPYLDAVTFRFYGDNKERDTALVEGDINMEFTTFATSAKFLTQRAQQGQGQVLRDQGSEEQLFLLLNMDKPPLDDVRIRRAISHAIDRNEYVKISDDDPSWINDNIFREDSPWNVPTDFPGFDPTKARALVAEYTKEKGSAPSFNMKTGDAVENQKIAQFFVKALNDVGMDVKPEVTSIDSYPTQLVFGQYDVGYVRLFGSIDPEGDRYWFESKNASRPGEGRLGLNLARVRDDEIDKALAEARATTDLTIRRDAYGRFQRRLAELVPYVWLTTGVKYLGTDDRVRGITNGPLPDGTPSMPVVVGVTRLTYTWMAA